MRDQARGKRRPTITLMPDEAKTVQDAIVKKHSAHDIASSDSSEAVVATNFFDVFGLNETAKANSPKVEKPKQEQEEIKEKDVLNMQLDPASGKLMVMSGSVSDILDCLIFYVNIQESFVSDLLFVHEYFTTTPNLLNGLKAHFMNTVKVSSEAKTEEEKKSAYKIMQDVQSRFTALIEVWIENHFYYFDDNLELLDVFQEFISIVLLDKKMVLKFRGLIGGTVIIRNYHTSYRSKKSSVAKDEVLSQLLREDKSGLIMDRRKVRSHHVCVFFFKNCLMCFS